MIKRMLVQSDWIMEPSAHALEVMADMKVELGKNSYIPKTFAMNWSKHNHQYHVHTHCADAKASSDSSLPRLRSHPWR